MQRAAQKGRCVGKNEKRKTASNRGHRTFKAVSDIFTFSSELLSSCQSHVPFSEGGSALLHYLHNYDERMVTLDGDCGNT